MLHAVEVKRDGSHSALYLNHRQTGEKKNGQYSTCGKKVKREMTAVPNTLYLNHGQTAEINSGQSQ